MHLHSKMRRMQAQRLAGSVAALLALSSPLALALPTTWTVNSCSDATSGSGTTGTLRYAVKHAASGDVVDMTHLTCSKISLHTGAIQVPQSRLTLEGPGRDRLEITGKYNGSVEHDRIFNHTGSGGTLYIDDLTLSFGYLKPASGTAADGGCIYSAGNVRLFGVDAYYCKAAAAGGARAYGGAVFARGGLSIDYTTLRGNIAYGGPGGLSFGGAAVTGKAFYAYYSTISGNSARGVGTNAPGSDGGVVAGGNLVLRGSTISGNHADGAVGGIAAFSSNNAGVVTEIIDSTISGNSAALYTGGLWTNSGKVNLYNSTIAFNTAVTGGSGSNPYSYAATGVTISDLTGPVSVTMDSTLIADNQFGNPLYFDSDLSMPTLASNVVFTGAGNLVTTHFPNSKDFLPAQTIEYACVLLGPLRDNGGLTKTHALLSHSPGIGAGNNMLFLPEDQRGRALDQAPYAYARESPTGYPDIGAYEIQQKDIIFDAGFDGCQ
jgi:hypothetical protein